MQLIDHIRNGWIRVEMAYPTYKALWRIAELIGHECGPANERDLKAFLLTVAEALDGGHSWVHYGDERHKFDVTIERKKLGE